MTNEEIKTKTTGLLINDIKTIANWTKEDIEKYITLLLLETDYEELRDINNDMSNGMISPEDWSIEIAQALGLIERKDEKDESPTDYIG